MKTFTPNTAKIRNQKKRILAEHLLVLSGCNEDVQEYCAPYIDQVVINHCTSNITAAVFKKKLEQQLLRASSLYRKNNSVNEVPSFPFLAYYSWFVSEAVKSLNDK